jgi:hypothetical protein
MSRKRNEHAPCQHCHGRHFGRCRYGKPRCGVVGESFLSENFCAAGRPPTGPAFAGYSVRRVAWANLDWSVPPGAGRETRLLGSRRSTYSAPALSLGDLRPRLSAAGSPVVRRPFAIAFRRNTGCGQGKGLLPGTTGPIHGQAAFRSSTSSALLTMLTTHRLRLESCDRTCCRVEHSERPVSRSPARAAGYGCRAEAAIPGTTT